VVEIFISEARERGQQIQTDLSEENWHSLEGQAHALKSAASNIGAEQLAESAQALECAVVIPQNRAQMPAISIGMQI
jgi:HPt (histidine-containing phosphotransfer) domain-containing protein